MNLEKKIENIKNGKDMVTVPLFAFMISLKYIYLLKQKIIAMYCKDSSLGRSKMYDSNITKDTYNNFILFKC